jgi:hypothetical protein
LCTFVSTGFCDTGGDGDDDEEEDDDDNLGEGMYGCSLCGGCFLDDNVETMMSKQCRNNVETMSKQCRTVQSILTLFLSHLFSGTGMGEGHGKDDVSEQIEDEEQVLGLKDEEQVPPEQDGNVFPFVSRMFVDLDF